MTQPYAYDLDNPLVYRNEMGRYKTDRQLSFIRRALPAAETKIVDIGGGGGRLAIPLADLGHEVTVVDVSSEALELLRSRSGGAITTVHSDLLSFDPSAPFEAALAIDMLKYMTEASMTELFTKVGTLLEPGGVFVFCEINQRSWRNRLSERLGRRREPYNIATADGYREALARAGFAVIEEEGLLWMPLAFNSNSASVRVFEAAERTLHLGGWIEQSPWLLIAARKLPHGAT
jgi:2-polyprenyl-3-methyl-5-hydroxy-6-metoxy-1,4-benzoquinol methylase